MTTARDIEQKIECCILKQILTSFDAILAQTIYQGCQQNQTKELHVSRDSYFSLELTKTVIRIICPSKNGDQF